MTRRREFTETDDKLLAMYIAKYNPQPEGRQGNTLYERLYENAEGKWPFAQRHTPSSWRNRYVTNKDRMDRKIAKFIKVAPPPAQPALSLSPRRPSSARVPFSDEDDANLIHYLATRAPKEALLGQNLWMELEDLHDTLPWVKRHTWQSWRERYKKYEKYFKQQIRRYHAGDEFDEPLYPKPKTVDHYRVKKSLPAKQAAAGPSHPRSNQSAQQKKPSGPAVQHNQVSQRSPADKRKRPRTSDAEIAERPAKKTRVENDSSNQQEDKSGPASRSQTVVADPEEVDDSQNVEKGVEEPAEAANNAANEDHPQDEQGVPGNKDTVSDSDEDDESEDDEPQGPPGSDDYRNEIFDSPTQVASGAIEDAPAGKEGATESDISEQEDELGDDGDPDEGVTYEQDGMDVEQGDDTAVELGLADEGRGAKDDEVFEAGDHSQGQADAAEPSGAHPSLADERSTVSPDPRDPPPRKHNIRIRETELPVVTPELSPLQEAAARHHGQQPVPRRHAKRIQKPKVIEIFGTPPPVASPGREDEGEDPSSPTSEAEARHYAHDRTKVRQPPRLDEGAFNKALSDPRGRPRISPSGKARRRSGVDFDDDDDADAADMQDEADDDADPNEEHASELPQWPPVRRKSSGKAKQQPRAPFPATPSPPGVGEGKQRRRTVTTQVVSVRTVRTVERRVDSRPKGTPYPRGRQAAVEEADEDENQDQDQAEEQADASPSSSRREVDNSPGAEDDTKMDEGDDAEEDNSWLVQSQHHPFSQVPHPFSQAVADSPVRHPARRSEIPLAKADLSRLERLLRPQHPDAGPSGTSPVSKSDASAHPKRAPLAEIDRARLEKMLRMEGKHAFPEPTKSAVPSPDFVASTSNAAGPSTRMSKGKARLADEAGEFGGFLSSPLADKGDQRPTRLEQQGQPVPPVASGSRVDKGKGRADRSPAHDVFYQPEQRSGASTSRHRARRSLPAMFAGDDSHLSSLTALGLALGPLPFGHARTPSIPSTLALSRSVSPAKSPNASLADTLPPAELEMVKELGMTAALHIMARNHGFNEDTVRAVYRQTGSLRLADEVLREMREGANDRASEVLSEMLSDDERDDDDDEEQEEERQSPAEGRRKGEEAEVERELTQPPAWPAEGASFDLADEAPLAESSRIDASHAPRRESRKRQRLLIEPVRHSSEPQYSPPKHTRAAQHLRRERESLGKSRRESAAAPMEVDAADKSARKELGDDVSFEELARLDSKGWQKLEEERGQGAGKILMGSSLAKLLQR